MRCSIMILLGAVVASCTTTPPEPRTAEAEAHLSKLLAGKVAGPALGCIPFYNGNDMIIVDDSTVLFKKGSTLYRNDFNGGSCDNIGSGFYTLVTERHGSGMCNGDIARVMDVKSGTQIGSCVWGDFTPYKKV